jgi:hypothetical protein
MTVEPTGLTRKPKTMGASGDESHGDFQTDPAALEPLFYYIPKSWKVWECAAGDGNLVRGFEEKGYKVLGTDKYYSGTNRVDYLEGSNLLKPEYDIAVTNPPFKYKDAFLARAYELRKPFAFLLPLTVFDSKKRQELFRTHGVQIIILPNRVKFLTPGKKEGGAWFAVCWVTWKLELPSQIVFWDPNNPQRRAPMMDKILSKGPRDSDISQGSLNTAKQTLFRLPRVTR